MRGVEPPILYGLYSDAILFPTCVGLNRQLAQSSEHFQTIPHMRGVEPFCARWEPASVALFPTCVGLNRYRYTKFHSLQDHLISFSPHAWG